MSLRRVSPIVVAVMAAGLGQFAIHPARSADTPASAVADATTLAAERYRPQAIDWQPCADNPVVDCGVLTLPVDYEKPRGETFGMAVARTRATDPEQRIGVLFTNPGGPGLSGVDFVTGAVANAPTFAPVRERFDIVSFDPRGVGASRPIQCTPGGVDLPPDLSDDAAVAAAFDEFSRGFAEECAQLDGPFASTVSTNNVARDMDRLRHALREKKVTYAAGSYGTLLGAVYASLFPKRVRAMALDAGINPSFRDYYVEETTNQLAAFELELQRVDTLCRRDTGCRLGETGVVTALDQVVATLDADPVTTPRGVVLTGGNAISAVYSLLYVEAAAPLVVDLLANALTGDYTLIEQVLPGVDAGLDVGAIYVIRCNDYGTRREAAEYLPVDEVVGARNPRFFGRFYLAYRLATCSDLPPADPPVIRDVSDSLDRPMVLVMNDFDPATPPADMRNLATALGMEQTIVRYRGGGHTFPKNDACTLDIFIGYLIDSTVPPEGTSCPGREISFAPAGAAVAEAPGTRSGSSVADTDERLWGVPAPLPQVR